MLTHKRFSALEAFCQMGKDLCEEAAAFSKTRFESQILFFRGQVTKYLAKVV